MTFRERITSGRMITGSWLSIPDIAVAEILAQAGFDFLLIDGEHAPIDPVQLFPLAVAAERRGCPVVYRVRSNDPGLIKAALDIGIAGLMVPMVETPAEAAAVVAAAKYPPAGRRGMGPWRAANYGIDSADYGRRANDETAIIVQIESGTAVGLAAEIAAISGVDALFVGPADLAGSLGLPVGSVAARLTEAIAHVAASARSTGRCAGIDATSSERLETYTGMGFRLFTYGVDADFLVAGSRAAAAEVRRIGAAKGA